MFAGMGAWADLEPQARRALAIGGIVALAGEIVPFTRFVFGYLGTLVHEFGHFVTNWIFGYPAVPAFDFMHGGGVTVHQDRNALLLIGVYALFAVAAYHLRENRKAMGLVGALAAVHAFAAFTSLHEMVELAAGHGAELIVAGIFLYRAMSGEKIRAEAERYAYAFAGAFILFDNVRLMSGLMTSHERRVEYELAKGGGAWMDLSRIGAEYLHVDLVPLAGFFLVLTFVVPFLALYCFRNRKEIAGGFARWLAA